MQIDDYETANALTTAITANLPILVHPTKELVKMLKAQGKKMDGTRSYTIKSVFYSGDMGGITCELNSSPEDQEVYAVSITHLKIDPSHPLAPEIQSYQRRRTRSLAIQNS